MKLVLKYIAVLFAMLGIAFSAKATHLVGGSMSYEYIGRLGNGNFQYRVTLKVYRDCAASNVQFDPEIEVGAYHARDNRTLATRFFFQLLKEIAVDPPRGADCPNAPNVCLREATYSRLIELAPSSFGYHLVFTRCCRNTQQNIVDDMGQTYYAFIPPSNIRNSSPFFTGVPAPYICVNDTTTYLNGASDPDGDSLSYKLVHPWAGATAAAPNPSPPATLNLPFPGVNYRSGFNQNIPFGTTGHASVDPFNGLTTMVPRGQGRYALAIEVTEWRNGQVLSTIRLDVQMIVIQCDPNNSPNISPSTGGFFRRVTAGESICFDIEAIDADLNRGNNQQSITIKGKGDIFSGGTGWTGPVATFTQKTAKLLVTSQFCWTPSCEQAKSFPYNFVIEAIDDGCPPKSRGVTFTIQVDPFIGQRNITGPVSVCQGSQTSVYSVPNPNNSTFKWTITGGVIVGPDNLNTITVNWTTPGTGRVRVVETSSTGCVGLPADLDITIAARPAQRNIFGPDTVCEFSSPVLYQVNPEGSNTYRWIIVGAVSVSNPQPHQALVSWGGAGNGQVMMIETNVAGCPGDTNFFYVAKTRSTLDSLYGSPSVCPNLRGVEYYVNGQPGASYQWKVEGGTLRSGNGSPRIIVDWGNAGIGKVKVLEITKWGCIGDTVSYTVIKNHNLAGIKPVGDPSVCEFSTGYRYEVIYTIGSNYYWTVNGGTVMQDNGTNWIVVDWGATGNGYVEVYETSYDSVNNIPCIGKPERLNVSINPLPTEDEIKGTFELCQSSGVYTYSLNGFPGSSYIWSIDGDTSGITGQGSSTISVNWNLDGLFTVAVKEITKDSCTSFTVDSAVLVNKKPVTSPITGDSIVCHPNVANHPYTTTGFPTSLYRWFINGGTINSGDSTPGISVDWSNQQENTLKVLEISDKGCPGDTIRLNVFADRPVLKMRVVSVGFPKDDHMEVRWELIDAPRFNSEFTVQRRVAGVTDSWRNVGTVTRDNLTFIDKNLNTDNTPFEYRIKAFDLCGREIVSDMHTSILLTGDKPDPYQVFINWTRYQGWTDGVRNYEVHRSVDFEPSFQLKRDRGSDTVDDYEDGFDHFAQRYRIRAWENGPDPDTSWSNEIVFNFEPVIWVPNAFTPNGDGLNNKFLIITGSIKTFQIDIYNRWGEFLFTSNDVDVSWDGTFKGEPSQEGVYIYKLRYTGADNKIKVMTGNITLLR